jgi:hypothetical protein
VKDRNNSVILIIICLFICIVAIIYVECDHGRFGRAIVIRLLLLLFFIIIIIVVVVVCSSLDNDGAMSAGTDDAVVLDNVDMLMPSPPRALPAAVDHGRRWKGPFQIVSEHVCLQEGRVDERRNTTHPAPGDATFVALLATAAQQIVQVGFPRLLLADTRTCRCSSLLNQRVRGRASRENLRLYS